MKNSIQLGRARSSLPIRLRKSIPSGEHRNGIGHMPGLFHSTPSWLITPRERIQANLIPAFAGMTDENTERWLLPEPLRRGIHPKPTCVVADEPIASGSALAGLAHVPRVRIIRPTSDARALTQRISARSFSLGVKPEKEPLAEWSPITSARRPGLCARIS